MKNSHIFICLLNLWRVLPIYCIAISQKSKSRLFQDLQVWKRWKELPFTSHFMVFLYLMSMYKEFRNIVYKRMGRWSYCVKWFCPPLATLYIHCNDIGGGMLIQHGFSTIITAQKIGNNVKIFQQVTIGYKGDKLPIIGNNVEICCGAKVLGGVVVKDVPAKAVMVGVPAKQIK